MRTRSLAKTIWALAALVAAIAAANIWTYYTTSTFPETWLLASLVVYGGVGLIAVVLAFVDRGSEATIPPARDPDEGAARASGRETGTAIEVAATPRTALAALVDVDAMRTWWGMRHGRVDLREGGIWALTWGDPKAGFQGSLMGRVSRYEPGAHLRVTGLSRVDGDHGVIGPTVLDVVVEAHGASTRIFLREHGFGEGPEWDAAYAAAIAGWSDTLQRLKRFLEKPVASPEDGRSAEASVAAPDAT